MAVEPAFHERSLFRMKSGATVLVTGGTGFLGGRIVARLVAQGYPVRVLARVGSNVGPLTALGAEIAYGDLGDAPSVDRAVKGAGVVIHAAAGTSGAARDCQTATVDGTRHVLDACKAAKVEKLIYVSSCSVYGVSGYKPDQVVTEESPLEQFPARRGNYSATKQQAEQLVAEAMGWDTFPIVILRPGTIYGPGAPIFTPMIGLSFGSRVFVVFGGGRHALPIVYVDDVADAVVRCLESGTANNQVFNVVGQERITKRRYMQELVKRACPGSLHLYLPYWLLFGMTWIQERLFSALRRDPILTTYRLVSSQRPVLYDSSKIERMLGWKARVLFEEAVERILGWRRNGEPHGRP